MPRSQVLVKPLGKRQLPTKSWLSLLNLNN
jgi:hypothetical protein